MSTAIASTNFVSVVICTHNPRASYLERVLSALAAQTLDRGFWELILVDNASVEPVGADLRWHPGARLVTESKLGLVHARSRGIQESTGGILIFVDDDNVLAPEYLDAARAIAGERPYLGAWSGQIRGEFEIEPPPWARPYVGMLALREPERDIWGNATESWDGTPWGAGMCVRRSVATAWIQALQHDPARQLLGRCGTGLAAAEDCDLAYTACDMGLGTGVFRRLQVMHLIPRERLELSYFTRLAEGTAFSEAILRSLRHGPPSIAPLSRAARLFRAYQLWRTDPVDREMQLAGERGRANAAHLLAHTNG